MKTISSILYTDITTLAVLAISAVFVWLVAGWGRNIYSFFIGK